MVICPHPLGHGAATVLKIMPDGAAWRVFIPSHHFEAVSRWNAGNMGQIHAGDAIVSVNGAATYSAIQKAPGFGTHAVPHEYY